ncbi:MAG: hypothetical protein LBK26_04870 [Rickettsiales bacterium]|jgi:hypothetical protein|nr:hypothetical protein [Rickettsiales bacterium]
MNEFKRNVYRNASVWLLATLGTFGGAKAQNSGNKTADSAYKGDRPEVITNTLSGNLDSTVIKDSCYFDTGTLKGEEPKNADSPENEVEKPEIINLDVLGDRIIEYDFKNKYDVDNLADFIRSVHPKIKVEKVGVKSVYDLTKLHGFYDMIGDTMQIRLFFVETQSDILSSGMKRPVTNTELKRDVEIRNFMAFFVLVHELDHMNKTRAFSQVGFTESQFQQMPLYKELNGPIAEMLLFRKLFLETMKIVRVTFTNGHDKAVFENVTPYQLTGLHRRGGIKNATSREIVYEKPELCAFVTQIFYQNPTVFEDSPSNFLNNYRAWLESCISYKIKMLRDTPDAEEIEEIIKIAADRMSETMSRYSTEMPRIARTEMKKAARDASMYLITGTFKDPRPAIGFNAACDIVNSHIVAGQEINFIKECPQYVMNALAKHFKYLSSGKNMRNVIKGFNGIGDIMASIAEKIGISQQSAYDMGVKHRETANGGPANMKTISSMSRHNEK